MNLSELKELLELITEQNITEFEIEEKDLRVRIKKGGEAVNGVATYSVESTSPQVAAAPVAAVHPSAPEPTDEGLVVVTAPMVGTFYRQSAPGADPFARNGDRVQKGQTLCIIEAMKLMNEIESEVVGEVVEIFVDDGQPVGFGDRLFSIRES